MQIRHDNTYPKHPLVRYDVPVLIEPLFGQHLVVVPPELDLVAEEQAAAVWSPDIGKRGMTEEEAEGSVDNVYGERARGWKEERGFHVRRDPTGGWVERTTRQV
jgi:hypothetical protein